MEKLAMMTSKKRKLQNVQQDKHDMTLLSASKQQQHEAYGKEELKMDQTSGNQDSQDVSVAAMQIQQQRKIPKIMLPKTDKSVPDIQLQKGEGTVTAYQTADGNMILLDEHTQFLHTDDMIKLGSLVPGCEPVIECPKSVVYKARDYIVYLKKEVEVLRDHLKNKSKGGFPLATDNQDHLPPISSIIDAPKSRSGPAK